MPLYTKADIGCYADGVHGHAHIRTALHQLVNEHAELLFSEDFGGEVLEALEGDMSDDAWEETVALDALNELCSDDVAFELVDGDLMLVKVGS